MSISTKEFKKGKMTETKTRQEQKPRVEGFLKDHEETAFAQSEIVGALDLPNPQVHQILKSLIKEGKIKANVVDSENSKGKAAKIIYYMWV